ncbi:MAG: dienelactone hydrolase family protein [Planctomycetota bacterium]
MISPTYTSGTDSINWESYEPTTYNGAVVILAYGSDGMAPPWASMIRDHAQALAAKGILAIIPDYFQKGVGAPHGDSVSVFGMIGARHAEWETALDDAVTEAAKLPNIDPSRIGLWGYSLGVFLCLRIRKRAAALVDFCGPYQFPTIGKPLLSGFAPSLNPNRGLKVQIHHGSADGLVPFDVHATAIEADLKAELATVTTFKYTDAGHGFASNSAADRTAIADSTQEAIDFLTTKL